MEALEKEHERVKEGINAYLEPLLDYKEQKDFWTKTLNPPMMYDHRPHDLGRSKRFISEGYKELQ